MTTSNPQSEYFHYQSYPEYAWLVDYINQFGNEGGFEQIYSRITSESCPVTGPIIARLLAYVLLAVNRWDSTRTSVLTGWCDTITFFHRPFGACSEYLTQAARDELTPACETGLK